MVAAFILSLVLTWNEYFFAALLTSTNANTLPVMVASQTGSARASTGGRWPRSPLAAILPLIVIAIVLETLHHQGHGRRRGEVVVLEGNDQRLSAEIVHALMLMGHGDDLLICDVNHPAATIAAETTYGRLIDMAGCDIPTGAPRS